MLLLILNMLKYPLHIVIALALMSRVLRFVYNFLRLVYFSFSEVRTAILPVTAFMVTGQ